MQDFVGNRSGDGEDARPQLPGDTIISLHSGCAWYP